MLMGGSANGTLPSTNSASSQFTEAAQAYLNNAEARNLAEDTRKKMATIFEKQLIAWASTRGYTAITQIANVEAIRDFRSTWKDAPLAVQKARSRSGILLLLPSARK